MRDALLALALLSAGCGHAARSRTLEPEAKTTVRVRNQNFLDMDVFVLQGGQRIRLGIGGLSTQVFTLPDYVLRGSQQLQFELHPIGGRANPRTETISVQPGDEVELIV